VKLYGELYDVERDLQEFDADGRRRIRQLRYRPIADALHQWLILHRQKVPDGSAPATVIDSSLNRGQALIRYLGDGTLPIDNNWVENRIRPIALGRLNWLFAGSLRAGERAATVMSLMQSAKLNDHDPYRYLKDTLARLQVRPNSHIAELLPHRWTPAVAGSCSVAGSPDPDRGRMTSPRAYAEKLSAEHQSPMGFPLEASSDQRNFGLTGRRH